MECIPIKAPDILISEIESLCKKTYPGSNLEFISYWIQYIGEIFDKGYPGYQPMDTVYHDLEHTYQTTLCWSRLICNRHSTAILPLITVNHFKIGFISILMHDLGYIKESSDFEGTGAKYTFVHERRSCELAQIILSSHKWSQRDIFSVQHLISCTGPRTLIDSIPFYNEIERIMGKAVCTADYLGQMSDPAYISKLSYLFKEFKESDNYRKIPKEKRLFSNAAEMLKKTPDFWQHIKNDVLEDQCSSLYKFLNVPYPNGENTYIQAIERNIEKVKELSAATSQPNE